MPRHVRTLEERSKAAMLKAIALDAQLTAKKAVENAKKSLEKAKKSIKKG